MNSVPGQRFKLKRLGLVILLLIVGWLPMGCSIAADRRPPSSLITPAPEPIASDRAVRPTPIATPSTPLKVALTPINRELSRKQLVEANTRFGFKLFQQIQQQQPDANVFISPSSVAIALSMAYNGANGETQKAMNTALQLNGMDLAGLNQANARLATDLEGADPQVKLKIANSLWAKQGINFNPEFLRRNERFYKAQVTSLDFKASDSLGQINNWVNRNTAGKIPKILDRLNPDDALYLINAVYFKGDWTEPFEPSDTQLEPFTLPSGEKKRFPAMRRSGTFRYAETDAFQAVNLPYGNGRWSMYIFLPKAKSNLTDFAQTLTAANWKTWMQAFRRQSGYVQLPKFKTEFSTGLKPSLTALGMGPAFDRAADFSQLTSDMQLLISQVQHKTFVEVNESGTEAAAVTGVTMVPTAARLPETPFSMVIDRPFFGAIHDAETDTVLFLGNIQNPAVP
jgi:serine protease inhibitor